MLTHTRRQALAALAALPLARAVQHWTPLTEWKANAPGSWRFEGGQIIADGPPSHLFYTGAGHESIRNFELELEVLTRPGANSGVYFHTRFQPDGFPKQGFEVQVNNTALGEGEYRERKRTGSLYGIRNVYKQIARDDEWFRMHIAVLANNVQVRINGILTVDYIEPAPAILPPSQETARFLQTGTFALQCHDAGSKTRFRNIRYRPLPADAPKLTPPVADDTYKKIIALGVHNYPLIDFHVHFHDSLGLPEAMEQSRRDGITYGLAVNADRQSRVRTDSALVAFAESVQGLTSFTGMQAEGGDWTRQFTRESCAHFDYIFNDGMIWTEPSGDRWTRLYREEDLGAITDAEAFAEEFTNRIVRMISTHPIDIYAIPTFLPEKFEALRAKLWTPARTDRIIATAARHQVAIELSGRYKIPNEDFVRKAKAAGCKFAFGTGNSTDKNLFRSEHGIEMIEKCGLAWNDMFVPGAFYPRAVERRAHLFSA